MSGQEERLREPPAERFAVDSMTLDLHAEITALRAESTPSNKHGLRQKTLYKHRGSTIALFVMHEGAFLADHQVAGTVNIQPLEGEIVTTAQGVEQVLQQGQILVLAPRVPHSVRADSPAVFLLRVCLEPSESNR